MGRTAPCWLSLVSRLRFGGDCQVLPLADPPGRSPSPCRPDKKLALIPTELLVPREPHRRVPAPFPVSPPPPPSEDPVALGSPLGSGSPGWTRATAACPAPSRPPSAMMQTPPGLTSGGTRSRGRAVQQSRAAVSSAGNLPALAFGEFQTPIPLPPARTSWHEPGFPAASPPPCFPLPPFCRATKSGSKEGAPDGHLEP